MTATRFNPYDWLQKPEKQKIPRPAARQAQSAGIEHEIEVIVSRIENYRLDLTLNYADWLTIGFALADAMGEGGRDYFHRVSRFHPNYDFQQCNIQFDKCLRRNKSGISIKTFFYLAQGAGISINTNQ